MTRIVRFSPSRLFSILIVAASSIAAFASTQTSAVSQPAVNSVATSNIVSTGAEASDQSVKSNASETGLKLVAGPGTPMPILPTKGGGSETGLKLVAGPGTPMPILPTKGGGSETGLKLVAGPGTPMPILPTKGGGSETRTLLS